jgi:hypothetical protein
VFFGVAGGAQALQSPRQERIPIASVMHDMIADRGRRHNVSRQALRAQRLTPQLSTSKLAPAFEFNRAKGLAMAFRVCGASISALAAPWGESLTQHPLDSSADTCCLQFAHGLSVTRCAEVQETIAHAC